MNCWEFIQCGREAGGAKIHELGLCRAYPDYGRQCAKVAGTLCGGRVQGSYAMKVFDCIHCDFYNSPYYDHGDHKVTSICNINLMASPSLSSASLTSSSTRFSRYS